MKAVSYKALCPGTPPGPAQYRIQHRKGGLTVPQDRTKSSQESSENHLTDHLGQVTSIFKECANSCTKQKMFARRERSTLTWLRYKNWCPHLHLPRHFSLSQDAKSSRKLGGNKPSLQCAAAAP